jgi:hypothetical protein
MKAKSLEMSRQVFTVSLLGAPSGYCQRDFVDESGMIRTQMGKSQHVSNGRSALDALHDTTP